MKEVKNKINQSKISIINDFFKEAESFFTIGKYQDALDVYNKILILSPDPKAEYFKLLCNSKIDEEDRFIKKSFILNSIYEGNSIYNLKEKTEFYSEILQINPLQTFTFHDSELEDKYWETIDKILITEPYNILALNRKADHELFGIEIPGDGLYPSYDSAVRLYDEVLKIDPSNKHALHGKQRASGGREIKKNFNKLNKEKVANLYQANRKSIEIFLTQDFIKGIPNKEKEEMIKKDLEYKKEKERQLTN